MMVFWEESFKMKFEIRVLWGSLQTSITRKNMRLIYLYCLLHILYISHSTDRSNLSNEKRKGTKKLATETSLRKFQSKSGAIQTKISLTSK